MTIKNLTIREEQGHGKLRWIRFSLATHSDPTLSDRAANYRALVPEIVREVRERTGITIECRVCRGGSGDVLLVRFFPWMRPWDGTTTKLLVRVDGEPRGEVCR
jgi:hypothetical protein